MTVNPDEADVDVPATASFRNDDASRDLKDVLLVDIARLSLGIETAQASEPNDPINVMKQTRGIIVRVFEGDQLTTQDHKQLGGTGEVSGIPPAPSANVQQITFYLDANGILHAHR